MSSIIESRAPPLEVAYRVSLSEPGGRAVNRSRIPVWLAAGSQWPALKADCGGSGGRGKPLPSRSSTSMTRPAGGGVVKVRLINEATATTTGTTPMGRVEMSSTASPIWSRSRPCSWMARDPAHAATGGGLVSMEVGEQSGPSIEPAGGK